MKSLVLLAGCGLGDGSCIEEVILTYLALEQYKWSYQPVAYDINMPSINHITEQPEENRNILVESARIGRGRIQEMDAIQPEDFDCLIIPGGIGLLSNYRKNESIRNLVLSFQEHNKPIATMCAGIDFLRSILGEELLQEEYKNLSPNDFCFDPDKNVYYTPAFRKATNLCDVQEGIARMIQAMDSHI